MYRFYDAQNQHFSFFFFYCTEIHLNDALCLVLSFKSVNTRLSCELCRWTFFAASQCASLQILEHRPQISKKKKEKRNNCRRKEGYKWRDNHTRHLLGSPLCDATREQTNVFTGQFWQWPTCTLIASKSTDEQASQHNFEKLISSVRFVFGCCFKLLKWSVVFHFRRKERLQFFPSLGGVFPVYLFFFVLSLLRKAVNFDSTHDKGFSGPSTAKSSLC